MRYISISCGSVGNAVVIGVRGLVDLTCGVALQLGGNGENVFLSDTKILKFLYNSSQGGGDSGQIVPVVWLAAGSTVELPKYLLRGGGEVSHQAAPGRGG